MTGTARNFEGFADLRTGSGNDTIRNHDTKSLRDLVDAGAGNDLIDFHAGNDDTAHGGAGVDRLSLTYNTTTTGVALTGLTGSLATGYSGMFDGYVSNNLTFTGIEDFTFIDQSGGNDDIRTGDGNDSLSGGGGNDNLLSAAGDDTIDGGEGADYWGGDLSAHARAFDIDLNTTSTLLGGTVQNIEGFRGLATGSGNDTITGHSTSGMADSVATGGGNDHLAGGEGNDTLAASSGEDTVDGGDGVDYYGADHSARLGSLVINLNEVSLIGNGRVENVEGFWNLRTGLGNDSVTGHLDHYMHEYVSTGAGNDLISLRAGGHDTVEGGAGSDRLALTYATTTTGVALTNLTANDAGGYDGMFDGYVSNNLSFTGIERFSFTDLSGGNDRIETGAGNDSLSAGAGNDVLRGAGGNDWLDGGDGTDRAVFGVAQTGVTVTGTNAALVLTSAEGQDTVMGVEFFDFTDGSLTWAEMLARSTTQLIGTAGNDRLTGTPWDDPMQGLAGNDLMRGLDGVDTLDGGAGDDVLIGGTSAADLRDVIYGGDGNDSMDGGYGNDELNGGNGNDTVLGGFGSDTVIGNAGDDVLVGGPGSDLMFGGPGNDFFNGGFGYDRLNGGTGADRFYHLGVADHASDWIQDYSATDGDVLVFGQSGATREQFQINIANTPNAGDASVAEAFVIYRPTGQIMWALVDGDGQSEINLQLGGQVFDLLA